MLDNYSYYINEGIYKIFDTEYMAKLIAYNYGTIQNNIITLDNLVILGEPCYFVFDKPCSLNSKNIKDTNNIFCVNCIDCSNCKYCQNCTNCDYNW